MEGIAVYTTIRLFHLLDIQYVFYTTGVMSLAYLLGLINIFAPSGIGVREGVLIYLLSYIMPTPLALIAAVILRIKAIIIDWVLIGSSLLKRV